MNLAAKQAACPPKSILLDLDTKVSEAPLKSAVAPRESFLWIDILRGLASFGVVLLHVRTELWCGLKPMLAEPARFSSFERMIGWLSVPTAFMGSGVMLFFLLSGFCIHRPYAKPSATMQYGSYARRRFYRIYPPYLVAVLLTAAVELLKSSLVGSAVTPAPDVVKTAFFVQYFGTPANMPANPALWSLPVEAELYVVYPLVFWLLHRWGMSAVAALCAAVSLAACVAWNGQYMGEVHFPKYWIIWVAGALMAERLRGTPPKWKPAYWLIAAVFVPAAIASEAGETLHQLRPYLWAAGFLPVIWWGLCHGEIIERIPPRLKKGFSYLGKISFSLYLIHYPFFHLSGALMVKWLGHKPTNYFVPLFFSVLAVGLAAAFYHLVEAPFHRLARRA
jgi:peptidoglycan/LPS O-acetylase OafA/YrhL